MMSEKSKSAKAKKIKIIHSKRRMLQLKRKGEMSHNIRYISKVPVRIVMDRDFLTLHPEDSISKLVENLRDEESSAVVVDEEGRLMGFITMKDLLHFFEPPRRYSIVGIGLLKKYSISHASRIRDIMVRKPITIHVEDDLGRAIKIMIETGKHHLPVIDENGHVHGVLEVKDIMRLIRIVSS
ncbi:CBS domain-containing protein [Thermococcus sp. 21S7]|uniref:CBS domain-containing protein n=1 Tax=Thermococcus sp. 21S7 TaxID=1638221 RepID=UPI00143AF227|nr:CBS domain-containing protein [Thermococcus sp. 21S7]NJE62535.1 CBS domain-containing protein [Thermococcus sp. 21S7]